MSVSGMASFLIQVAVFKLPFLIVYVCGIVLAARYRSQWPKPAKLVTIAGGLLCSSWAIGVVQQFIVMRDVSPRETPLLTVLPLPMLVLSVVGNSLLIASAFAGRKPSETADRGDNAKEELKELERLLTTGSISKQEYELRRRRILEGI